MKKVIFLFGGSLSGMCMCPFIVLAMWPDEIIKIFPQVVTFFGLFWLAIMAFMWVLRNYWSI